MAGYQAHLTAGAAVGAAGLAGCWLLDFYRPDALVAAALVAVAMLASMFPDTDTSSMGRRLFYMIMLAIDLVLLLNKRYEWAAFTGLMAILPGIGPHRGWTHAWWAALAVPLPVIILPPLLWDINVYGALPFYLAAVAGYLSHLALDRL